VAFKTGFWATGYNLPAGATHHWYQDVGPAYSVINWFAAQPVFARREDPEVRLAVKVFYLKHANSNNLQVNVLVENIGVSKAWAYIIYWATNK
jgi:hypothetical protein